MEHKKVHRPDAARAEGFKLGVAIPARHSEECHNAFSKFKAAKDALVVPQRACPKCQTRHAVLRGDSNVTGKQNP